MPFQVRIGSLGGTVFFQVGRYAPLQAKKKRKEKKVSPTCKKCLFLVNSQNFFIKGAGWCSSNFFSCLNKHFSSICFCFIVFYFYLNYQATCINFFSLLHKCNYNNAHIISYNITGRLLGHYIYLQRSFIIKLLTVGYSRFTGFLPSVQLSASTCEEISFQ